MGGGNLRKGGGEGPSVTWCLSCLIGYYANTELKT